MRTLLSPIQKLSDLNFRNDACGLNVSQPYLTTVQSPTDGFIYKPVRANSIPSAVYLFRKREKDIELTFSFVDCTFSVLSGEGIGAVDAMTLFANRLLESGVQYQLL